jgi:hypothetical protein
MMRRALCLAALSAAAALLGGCQHRTLGGTVRVTGVAPFMEMLLVPSSGGQGIPLSGPPALNQVVGLEIAAVGQDEAGKFRVERFNVISANGIPATDGRLVQEGDRFQVVTEGGARHTLVSPPPGLRSHVGRRVWVSGPLDREPVAYGVIE